MVNLFRFILGAGRSSTVRNAEPDASDQSEAWYAVEPRAWQVTCSAIDVAAEGRLAEINGRVLAIYAESELRALGYVYAYLILCKAGEDLLGLDPTRAEVDELADDLAPEWAAFQNATSTQLRHTLVSALRGTQEGSEILNAHPRIEHAVVAAALVLRRLGNPSANSYLERVMKMLLDYREVRDPGSVLEYLRAADSTPGQ